MASLEILTSPRAGPWVVAQDGQLLLCEGFPRVSVVGQVPSGRWDSSDFRIASSDDGRVLGASYEHGDVWCWDASIRDVAWEARVACVGGLSVISNRYVCVATEHSTGSWTAVLDLQSGKKLLRERGFALPMNSGERLVIQDSGAWVRSSGDDVSRGTFSAKCRVIEAWPFGDAVFLYVGAGNAVVAVWPETGEVREIRELFGPPVFAVASEGRRIVARSRRGDLLIWAMSQQSGAPLELVGELPREWSRLLGRLSGCGRWYVLRNGEYIDTRDGIRGRVTVSDTP